MVCHTTPDGGGFVGSVTNYIDCQAQTLGSSGWQALAMPGSTLSLVLTGFLAIFIAVIGYNLLLGQRLTVRAGTLAFVKIGAVLALATSWPAYRTLVYDIVIDGPSQIVREIGPQAGVPGADGTLTQRLDLVDQNLAQLAILGPGNILAAREANVPPPPFVGFSAFALGGSRILFLLTAVASLASIRIVAGLMLALGPFFIAFLMFDHTRSLFEGWVRVLAGSALAAIGVSIALGLQLALLEPWLASVLARRMSEESLPTVPVELFVLIALFAIIVVVALMASARLAGAFRLPAVMRSLPSPPESLWPVRSEAVGTASHRIERTESERTRAAAIANSVSSMERRGAGFDSFSRAIPTMGVASSSAREAERVRVATPVGRSFARRSAMRTSARADRRDAGA